MRLNNHAAHLSLSSPQIPYQPSFRRRTLHFLHAVTTILITSLEILLQPQVIAHLYSEKTPWRIESAALVQPRAESPSLDH